jgi:hypothetical protein
MFKMLEKLAALKCFLTRCCLYWICMWTIMNKDWCYVKYLVIIIILYVPLHALFPLILFQRQNFFLDNKVILSSAVADSWIWKISCLCSLFGHGLQLRIIPWHVGGGLI